MLFYKSFPILSIIFQVFFPMRRNRTFWFLFHSILKQILSTFFCFVWSDIVFLFITRQTSSRRVDGSVWFRSSSYHSIRILFLDKNNAIIHILKFWDILRSSCWNFSFKYLFIFRSFLFMFIRKYYFFGFNRTCDKPFGLWLGKYRLRLGKYRLRLIENPWLRVF